MSTGKQIRMNRIFRKSTGRSVIVAADHGGIAGPLDGINNPAELVRECSEGGADAILATRGFSRAAEDAFTPGPALILRLTGGFTVLGGGFEEEMISSAETALRYASAGAAVTVKFGHRREGDFIRQASLVSDRCEEWGLPLMIEVMARQNDSRGAVSGDIAVAARAAAEIGADIIKTSYTGDPESFSRVVEGCPVPVVILGGVKTESVGELFRAVYASLQAGGAGVAIGRNIWQHGNTRKMVGAMCGLVHEGWTAEQASEYVAG